MPGWSDEELLIQWVAMVAPLICDGESDAVVIAHLDRQIRFDLAGRADAGLRELIPVLDQAMHEVAIAFSK